MKELLRTNNLVIISYVEALMKAEGIDYFIADQAISATEGSIGLFPRRIMVERGQFARARQLLIDADLGDELRV
jgi:hypothetical protein